MVTEAPPSLRVCEGDSVAGYVGYVKKTVITSLLHEVWRREEERFEEGVCVCV